MLTPLPDPAGDRARDGARRSPARAAGEPEGALVLLHGRGADEHDLFPLLDLLDPERRLLGITPGGPLALPPGGAPLVRARRDPDARPDDVPRHGAAAHRLPRRAAGADRARRARRLLAGRRDELGARARPGPAAPGRDHRACRASCRRSTAGRSLAESARRRPGRRRARLARPGDPGSVRRRGGGRRSRRPAPTCSGARRPCRTRSTRAWLPPLRALVRRLPTPA